MNPNQKLDYDPFNPLPLREDEGIKRYLNAESFSVACERFITSRDVRLCRSRAVVAIFKYSKCENFDPLVPYLAMNYFDRCILRINPAPAVMNDRLQDLDVLIICCLTLASKIRNKDFKISKLQEEKPDLNVVTPEQFQIMELHIIKALNWRLRVVTPFCFVPYFESKLNSTYGFRKRTINQMIIQSLNDIKNTSYKPSVIAASALLAASSFLYPDQLAGFTGLIISQGIFRDFKERQNVELCTVSLIKLCNELKLLIESGFAENESHPKKSVRAGEDQSEDDQEVQPAEAPDVVEIREENITADELDFPLRWRDGESNEAEFVIFQTEDLPSESETDADEMEAMRQMWRGRLEERWALEMAQARLLGFEGEATLNISNCCHLQ